MTGYPRAQGLAVVLAAVAGAAAQQEGEGQPPCPVCRDEFHEPGPLCHDVTGELVDFEVLDDEGREAAGTEEA